MIQLLHGDCLELINSIPSNSINLVVTVSTAYCVDTGELYMYEASNDNWDEQ